MSKEFIILIILVAIVLQAMGGYLDMSGKQSIGPMTKHHLWNDARFALILAGVLLLLKRNF